MSRSYYDQFFGAPASAALVLANNEECLFRSPEARDIVGMKRQCDCEHCPLGSEGCTFKNKYGEAVHGFSCADPEQWIEAFDNTPGLYHAMFGTPDRAANTVVDMELCVAGMFYLEPYSENTDRDCWACPFGHDGMCMCEDELPSQDAVLVYDCLMSSIPDCVAKHISDWWAS